MNNGIDTLKRENLRLKSAVHELSTLNQISRVIDSTMSIEDISKRIMKIIVSAIDADEAAVHTFSDQAKNLSPKTFVRGKFESSLISKTRFDVNIAGWIAKYRKPLLINDVHSDKRFSSVNSVQNPLNSLLTVPLTAKGQLIGALSVFNSHKTDGFSADDVRLLTIIGTQAAQIIENARLYQKELQLAQLQGEIQAAQKIQQGFLPSNTPEVKGFDIYGGTLAAKNVGGDFFDFIPGNNQQFFFSIGDVSGKGMPAALLMSTIQGQVRLIVKRDPDLNLKAMFRELNSIVFQLSGSAQFATMIIGHIDHNQNISISNAGHCYPIIISPSGELKEIADSALMVGIVEEVDFSQIEFKMEPGELLVLASDGVDEAFNPDQVQFGMDRFKNVLLANRVAEAEEIYQKVIESIGKFRQGAEQSDDLTLLIIKRKPC